MASHVQCLVEYNPDPLDFNIYLHPSKLSSLGLSDCSIVRIRSPSADTIASALGFEDTESISGIRLGRYHLVNLNVYFGQLVSVEPAGPCPPADHICIAPIEGTLQGLSARPSDILPLIEYDFLSIPVQQNSIFPVYILHRVIEFQVMKSVPCGPVLMGSRDVIVITEKVVKRPNTRRFDSISYDSIGGLSSTIQSFRFLIELPLVQPSLSKALGISRPRGFLLSAPEGCGKSLFAKALAEEVPVHFQSVKGYDLLTRKPEEAAYIFVRLADRAISRAPALVFIDDLDRVLQEPQVGGGIDRRLTYAVVSLVDKLLAHPGIIVIGAVRDLASVPPFLRTGHRFAHEIEIRSPSVEQKVQIVQAIARPMRPTQQAVDSIANDEHLTSGADIRMRIDTAILDQVSAIFARQKTPDNSLTIDQIRSIVIEKRGMGKRRSGPFGPAPRSSPADDSFASPRPECHADAPQSAPETVPPDDFATSADPPDAARAPLPRISSGSLDTSYSESGAKPWSVDPFAPPEEHEPFCLFL
jgi:AAA+ superfamily predicted ATPase